MLIAYCKNRSLSPLPPFGRGEYNGVRVDDS